MENPLQPCQTTQLVGLFATRSICPAVRMKERLLTLVADLDQGGKVNSGTRIRNAYPALLG
ncbi:hypothetical protein SAMN05661010_02167 [Modicisalibacter muralis]|uniref:Uncharacterized protein n=1 Tax=Modicisalibacter muralis TaxID=119000 RepID=A0A1G9LMT4_9GAMM|nr:hypothetical protein SAMN05661010_02167 [Halomonas muralis]